MRIVQIEDEAGLRALKPAWESLLKAARSSTTFQTWEWAVAWWSTYGKPGELRVLAVFDDGGVLRGIAPLRSEVGRRYGQVVPAISFLGDGSNDSDYLDFIIAAGYEQPAMKAFKGYLMEQLGRGTVLRLNEIPEHSPTLSLLETTATELNLILQATNVPCGTVPLPAAWDEYVGMLKPRFRSKVRSTLRSLEERPEVQFGICQTQKQLESLLPVLFDLHTRRWAMEAKSGVFGWNQKRQFYCTLSPMLLERGWLRFTWLQWKERILACQYGFAYNGTYFQLQEGYEPEAEHWNPGIGLRAWSIRQFIQDGLREYDFLSGIGRHKSDWASEVKYSRQILLAKPTPKTVLFCRGPELTTRTREFVKRSLPAWVVARRQARLEKRNVVDFAASRWMRQAAANCYVHLHLPKLVQPLRSQYQLALSPKGTRPKLSLKKRQEASARILYYHRVNDDGDPFFPAISTALFEQEMKYLARHYKVVSLPNLLKHLENGSPEGMLAITFDDGYQDNYQNAFPILQRYGLPATIFLTTGSIDSREPLWFEQLAGAIQKTSLEHLDLEIDIPRRYRMRTVAERLAANSGIFSLMRALPDGERRIWLDRVLRQLGGPDANRRGKMLTWDQVLTMKANGIDFGGHTVTHPFIARLSPEQVVWEVSECKRRIEDELQLPVECFAYPNGREEDFGKWNKNAIRSAGYRAAVTTIWGLNYRSTDPMELRRGGPWEESPALFAYKMDWYELTER